MLKEKILNEEIKMYLVNDNFRIYGKTFDVKEELKQVGANWNSENQRLEMSQEDFQKLDVEIQNKVFEVMERQKQISLKNVAQILLSGRIKAYLNQNGEYQIYGRTKEIFKDLHNIGFKLNDNNYSIKEEDFERIFSNEVKEFVNEYQYNNDYKKQTQETFEGEQEYL